MAGLHKYESLIDGSLHIEDIAIMNDLLNIKYENEERYKEACE